MATYVLPNMSWSEDEPLLIKLVKAGEKIQVKTLLDKGTNVNVKDKYGKTALMYGSERGHTALMDVAEHAKDWTCEVIDLLIANGANVNAKDKYGQTALMNVACWGPKEIVECLIDKGADVNAKAKSGETALKRAAHSHHNDIVEMLKQHGAKE